MKHFYKNTEKNFSLNNPNVVAIQENTTEEQFNLAHQEIRTNQLSLISNTSSSDTTLPVLLNNKNISSSTPLKSNNKSISHIPKRITTTTNNTTTSLQKEENEMLKMGFTWIKTDLLSSSK